MPQVSGVAAPSAGFSQKLNEFSEKINEFLEKINNFLSGAHMGPPGASRQVVVTGGPGLLCRVPHLNQLMADDAAAHPLNEEK